MSRSGRAGISTLAATALGGAAPAGAPLPRRRPDARML